MTSKAPTFTRISYTSNHTYNTHIWGFHEAKYGIEDVKTAPPQTKWLLSHAKHKQAGNNTAFKNTSTPLRSNIRYPAACRTLPGSIHV